MKNEDIYDGITNICDDYIEGTNEHKLKKKRRYTVWITGIAAVLSIAIFIGIIAPFGTNAYAISIAEYPDMPQYPNDEDYYNSIGEWDHESYSEDMDDWREAQQALESDIDFSGELSHFLNATVPHFLSKTQGENKVYSPLNVYLALSMLTEITDGSSRQQLLDLLGSEDIDALRTQANALWKANYSDDGKTTSILASSLWLNEDIEFNQSTMDTIAENYYTSSYQGEMGSADFNNAFHDWLNEQTGGLLEEQVEGIEFNSATILALATTIYFKATWDDEFYEGATSSDTFHADKGDIECDFMHKSDIRNYYQAENFTSVSEGLENNNNMWFILPNEGVSVDELLADSEIMDFIQKGSEWDNKIEYTVNLSVPKFDVTSQLDLIDRLIELGVTDVFDSAVSDFSPLTDDLNGLAVTQAQHDARVMIDEEGCTGAAYTVIAVDETAEEMASPREVDFTLDRPFIFVITGADGLPIFVGVVNQPV